MTQVPTAESAFEPSIVKGVSKTTFLISIVSMLNDVANEMVVPLLPLFITVGLGASVASVGVIEGVASGLSSLFVILPGLWSDRLEKRMPFVITGYGVSVVGRLLLLLSGSWWTILAARVTDRFGRSIRSAARDALIADSAPDEAHGRNFGFFNSVDTLGSLIGPLLASALLFAVPNNFRLLFAVTLIPSVLLMGLLLLIREKKGGALSVKRVTLIHFRQLPHTFYWMLAILTIFSLSTTSDAFLVLQAQHLGMTLPLIPIAYALVSLTGALAGYPAGVLADRIGHYPTLLLGMAIHGLSYLGFAFSGLIGAVAIWPLFLLYGLVVLVSVSARPLLFSNVPKELRGTASGLLTTCAGGAALIGNVLGGVIWASNGSSTFFLVCAVLAAAAMLMLLFIPLIDRSVKFK